MRARFSSFVALFSVLFISLVSHAGMQEDLEALRDSGKDYQTVGTICEEVSRLEFQRQYLAPAYTVVTGIAYGDNSRTIGELDVVVFETRSQKAILVAEVKCWKDMSGGLSKAHNQRKRFVDTVRSRDGLFFRSTFDYHQYNQKQFTQVQNFMTVGQKGALGAGYDAELSYPLEQLMQMRQMMLSCQSTGQCQVGPKQGQYPQQHGAHYGAY